MQPWVDIVGYASAALFLATVLAPQWVGRRVSELASGVGFAVYGALLAAWPVAILGAVLAVASALRLRHHYAAPAASEITAVRMEPHHPFLEDFLRANLADIRRSQPSFDLDDEREFVLVVNRHGFPAGVLLGRSLGAELDIVLDYVTPRFRDSRTGRWLFGEGRSTFTDAGFKRLVASPTTYEHRTYLEALGFSPEGARLVKEL